MMGTKRWPKKAARGGYRRILGARDVAVANDDHPSARGAKPRDDRKGWRAAIRRAAIKFRRLLGSGVAENAAEAREAVAHFLKEMESVAARTYPAWSKTLGDGLSDCSLNYDERRS